MRAVLADDIILSMSSMTVINDMTLATRLVGPASLN
jgi:hypothetical protein